MPDGAIVPPELIEALSIRPPLSFSWFGRRNGAGSPRLRALLTRAQLLADLEERIARTLYANFYCAGVPRPERAAPPDGRSDPSFLAELSRANCGSGCADPGWKPSSSTGTVFRKNGVAFRAPRGVRGLVLPKELLRLAPGFYMALGDRGFRANETIARVYWNVEPRGAPRFVRAATRLMNARGIPFRLKVADDPGAYDRCDAAVLYVPRAVARAETLLLQSIRRDLRPFLRGSTSPFTKRLAPGVALAEEPGSGQSFGMDRCQLVASALVSARLTRSAADGAIVAAFRARGLDPDHPYLEPGGTDRYPVLAS